MKFDWKQALLLLGIAMVGTYVAYHSKTVWNLVAPPAAGPALP